MIVLAVQLQPEVCLLCFRKRNVLLNAQFLELQELVNCLLKVSGAVTDETLRFILILYLAIQINNLLVKLRQSLDKFFVNMLCLNRAILWAFDGPDILNKKSE